MPSTFYCRPGRKTLGVPATHWSARLKPFQRCEFPGLSFPPPKGCGNEGNPKLGGSQRFFEFYAPKPWGCMIQFEHMFFSNGLVVPPTRKKNMFIRDNPPGLPRVLSSMQTCTWPALYQWRIPTKASSFENIGLITQPPPTNQGFVKGNDHSTARLFGWERWS